VETATPTPTEEPTATPTEEAAARPLPSSTPTTLTATTGTVNGSICLPEEIRATSVVLYFDEVNTGEVIVLPIRAIQTNYRISLPVGTYVAYAWLNNGTIGGGYTEAVVCGLDDETCTDHQLRPFRVQAGVRTNNINICDWTGDAIPAPTPLSTNR
jgi:hypothetical protein